MKRYASHYLLLPSVGVVKQYVIELLPDGSICRTFPLLEEIESAEWLPGIIVLLTAGEAEFLLSQKELFNVSSVSDDCFSDALQAMICNGTHLFPYWFYPFDFISMQPVAETRHRLLR